MPTETTEVENFNARLRTIKPKENLELGMHGIKGATHIFTIRYGLMAKPTIVTDNDCNSTYSTRYN